MELISSELLKLQDSYKTAIETTKSAKKQLDSEISRQKPTNWEFEHQKKRTEEYEVQLEKTKKDIDAMAHYLPMISKAWFTNILYHKKSVCIVWHVPVTFWGDNRWRLQTLSSRMDSEELNLLLLRFPWGWAEIMAKR